LKTIGNVRRELNKAYKRLADQGGWRAVGREFDIDGAMAFRIARQGYEPHDPKIRTKLGLPTIVQVAACPVCGEVHVKKSCPHSAISRQPKRIYDWPVERLRWALENREEF
jgi:hypothetical protein